MKLNQAKARRQLRRGSLAPRGGYRYLGGSFVWFDEAQRLPEDLLSQLGRASIEEFEFIEQEDE